MDSLERARCCCDSSEVIGYSVLGREIVAYIKGNGLRKILIHGSIHAREYITARLIVQLLEDYKGDSQIWFVPIVNPDGVALVNGGLLTVDRIRHKMLLKYNGYRDDFSQWKANINGVDLNVNFDAQWGEGQYNIQYPNYENYIGPYAFSEPETQALRNITLREDFVMTISYHTKGQEIYWGFGDNYDYYEEAMSFSRLTGYPLIKSHGSAGGYKDWFTKKFSRLGLTIEVGNDKYPHPLREEAYDEIWQENKDIANLADNVAWKLGYK